MAEGAIPLRERRTFGEEWDEYEDKVIPATAGAVQRAETKLAFYSGAFVMLRLLANSLDADHDPTALDIQYLESVDRELLEELRKQVPKRD